MTDEKRAEYQAAADKVGVSLAQWIRDACDSRLRRGPDVVGRTKSGKPVTESDIERLSVEAERGYDLSRFKGPNPKPSQRKKETK